MRKRKKALIVGISDYGSRLPRLDSPEREIQEWRDLLMDEYGFGCSDIRLLANERARKDEILYRLDWLFKDAGEDDQLVFMYGGHGVRIQRRDRDSGEILDNMDEALIAYPSSPNDDLEQMAIFDDDLFKLYVDTGAYQAKVTMILDCCFGGGFNSQDLPRRPSVMSVMAPVDLRHRSLRASRGYNEFGSCSCGGNGRSAATGNGNGNGNGRIRMPVIVNAAGELNLSVELDLEGDRRSLFSYHALDVLRRNPEITYNELLDEIRTPIEQYYPQHPTLRGDQARQYQSVLN